MANLGIDVGASKVRYVIWEEDHTSLDEEVKLSSPSREELRRVFQAITQKIKRDQIVISAAGVGLPGTVERESVTSAPNFPTLAGWNIKAELENLWGVPVKIINDAKAFVIAETQAGTAQGKRNVIGLTLGSGLGSGIVLNSDLYLGEGTAGEVGHEIVDLPNRKEAEELVSAKFFQKFGKSPDELRRLAETGDLSAKQAFNEFGKNLGVIVANLVNLLDPEAVVLGGGIAGAYDLFIESTRETAAEFIVNPDRKNIEIKQASLGPAAGAIGAALYATKAW